MRQLKAWVVAATLTVVMGAAWAAPIAVPVGYAPGSGLFVQSQSSAGEVVVYDDTTDLNNYLSYWGGAGDGSPVGDEVTLGPGGRRITKFELDYYSPEACTADTTLRFYLNDDGGYPGTVLVELDLGEVTYDGMGTLSTAVPEVAVPDSFTWAVEWNNIDPTATRLGPLIWNPPTVGSSDDYFFWDDGTGFDAYWFGGDPVANFAAKIWAVPEPATVTLLALGGLGLVARRRRKR